MLTSAAAAEMFERAILSLASLPGVVEGIAIITLSSCFLLTLLSFALSAALATLLTFAFAALRGLACPFPALIVLEG